MAIGSTTNIIRGPIQLCKAPTDLSLSFPHGGTALGLSNKDIVLVPTVARERIQAEEFGSEIVDEVYLGETWVLTGILREWDDDLISDIFLNTKVGSVTGKRVIEFPGTRKAGRFRSQDAIKLCASPLREPTNNPMVIFYNAIPMIEETAAFNFQLKSNLEFGFVFLALRDTQGRSIQIGFKDDLSL